jgi:hypothetical protein
MKRIQFGPVFVSMYIQSKVEPYTQTEFSITLQFLPVAFCSGLLTVSIEFHPP